MYELNRFKDLIFVDKTTPLDVLFFIIKTNPCSKPPESYKNIKDFKKLCDIISQSEKIKIDLKNIQGKDLSYLATYMNPLEKEWTKKTLTKAFEHHVNFFKNLNKDSVLNFNMENIGAKTAKKPENIDIVMLYRYCQEKKISTVSEDNISSIYNKIKYNDMSEKDIVSKIVTRLKTFNKDNLISLLHDIKSIKNTDKISYDGKTFNKPDTYDICSRIFYTDEEAVFIAASKFHIDLRDSTCPSLELSFYSNKKGEYIPRCKKFRNKYLKNKDFYDLTKFWKPSFCNFYNDNILQILANIENLNRNERNDIIMSLNSRFLMKNFYQGYLPFLKEEETLLYNNEIKNIDKKEIICYGIMESEKFIILTPEEIEASFRAYSNFLDFENADEKLEEMPMTKLIKICETNLENKTYLKLYETIEDVKVKLRLVDDIISDFEKIYKNDSTGKIKSQIDEFLKLLFESSMYMRGWKVGKNTDYPLKRDDCNWASDNHTADVFKNSSLSLTALTDFVEAMDKKIKKIIKKLPLICYNKNFIKSKSKDEGLTVMDRIEIVKGKYDSVYSCIRMSSNCIAGSAYYYYNVVKNQKLFNIKEMDLIS